MICHDEDYFNENIKFNAKLPFHLRRKQLNALKPSRTLIYHESIPAGSPHKKCLPRLSQTPRISTIIYLVTTQYPASLGNYQVYKLWLSRRKQASGWARTMIYSRK